MDVISKQLVMSEGVCALAALQSFAVINGHMFQEVSWAYLSADWTLVQVVAVVDGVLSVASTQMALQSLETK